MSLTDLGNWGYHIGGVGILVLTLVFLIAVRWTSDLLGRVLAAMFVTVSAIFLTGGYRLVYGEDSVGFLIWRAFLYTSFGVVIWGALFAFIWTQFFAPRVRRRTTRKEYEGEESALADSGSDRNGDSHDRAGSNC